MHLLSKKAAPIYIRKLFYIFLIVMPLKFCQPDMDIYYILYSVAFFLILVKVSLFSYDCCQILWHFDDSSVYFLWAFCYIFLISFSQPHKLPTCEMSIISAISKRVLDFLLPIWFLIAPNLSALRLCLTIKALQLKPDLGCFLMELSKTHFPLKQCFTLSTCKNIMYYGN